jgi:uncharacterized protein (TIGR03435 family)
MRHIISATAVLTLLASGAFGQAADAKIVFETASVKPAAPIVPSRGLCCIGPSISDPSIVRFSGATLIDIIGAAYGVDLDQISGPSWFGDERYDMAATIGPRATREQSKIMLQNLLAERFQIVLHHAPKDFPAYELTIAKGGEKLREAVNPQPCDGGRDFSTDANGFPYIPSGICGVRP